MYSQKCNCFAINADSIYPRVQMTQGLDSGHAPLYHCDNCSSQAIVLPFSFCFYGKNYDTVFVNNKGNLTFNHPDFTFSPTGFPFGKDTLMLAPFYADIDDSTTMVLQQILADVSYTLTPTHLTVQWGTVGYNIIDCDFYDNFQITITNGSDTILPAGNNVSFCYYLMQWASGDSGSIGFNGTLAKIAVNKGDGVHYAQFGTFRNRGYYFYGPYDTNSELYWLDSKSFIFNTCVKGDNIPPVIINSDSCLNDTVCAGDTLLFRNSFLCPQQGQKAAITVSAPGLSGLTTDTMSANSIYHNLTLLAATLSDAGAHTITFTATDNSSPPLTNYIQRKIFVKNCDTSLSIKSLRPGSSVFEIYPNPNQGEFTIQSSVVSCQSSVRISRIEIYNFLGMEVFTHDLPIVNSQSSIDLSAQPDGVYLIRIIPSDGGMPSSDKFVIAKDK